MVIYSFYASMVMPRLLCVKDLAKLWGMHLRLLLEEKAYSILKQKSPEVMAMTSGTN